MYFYKAGTERRPLLLPRSQTWKKVWNIILNAHMINLSFLKLYDEYLRLYYSAILKQWIPSNFFYQLYLSWLYISFVTLACTLQERYFSIFTRLDKVTEKDHLQKMHLMTETSPLKWSQFVFAIFRVSSFPREKRLTVPNWKYNTEGKKNLPYLPDYIKYVLIEKAAIWEREKKLIASKGFCNKLVLIARKRKTISPHFFLEDPLFIMVANFVKQNCLY